MQKKSLGRTPSERTLDRNRDDVKRLLPRQRTQADWLAAELAAEVGYWELGEKVHRSTVARMVAMAMVGTEDLPVLTMAEALTALEVRLGREARAEEESAALVEAAAVQAARAAGM